MQTQKPSRRTKKNKDVLETARQKARDASQDIVSGQYHHAIELADEGLALLENVGPSPERDHVRFDLLIERGRAREVLGDYASLADFQIVRSDSDDLAQQAIAMVGIANCRTGTGEYTLAEEAYKIAIEEAQSGGYNLCAIRAWGGLGTLYWKQGRIEEAVKALFKARSLLQRNPDVRELGRVMIALGIAHQFAGRLDQAIAAHEEALSCFRTLGDLHRTAAAMNNLGELYQELRDMERALQYHEEALSVASEARGDLIAIDITRNIGVDLLLTGRYSEAMMALNKALSEARNFGDKDFILQALYSMSDALLRQGDVNRAMTIAIELAAEAQAVHSELHSAKAKYLQGRAHLARGERKQAQAVLQDALGEAHASTSRLLLWRLHAALGRASDDEQVAQIHFRIAADFVRQTAEPLDDPDMRSRFLEQPEVKAVLKRAG